MVLCVPDTEIRVKGTDPAGQGESVLAYFIL